MLTVYIKMFALARASMNEVAARVTNKARLRVTEGRNGVRRLPLAGPHKARRDIVVCVCARARDYYSRRSGWIRAPLSRFGRAVGGE